jgi:branched-chain amino acid transport system substrate-binding protein
MRTSRRNALKLSLSAMGAGAGLAALPRSRARAAAIAAPIRLGLLCVKTGPLAAGGLQMEQGLTIFLDRQKQTLAGRKVQLFVEDTQGVPAVTLAKAQELVERDKVDAIIGPLAAFELYAIIGYTTKQRMPLIGIAAAENVTQRAPSPWFIRPASTSAQCTQPFGEYAAKTLGYRKMAMLADDFAFGYEQCAGFMRVFEDNGGKIIQRLWPPLNAPDYGTYIAEIRPDADAVFIGFAGANGFRFTQQYFQYGLGGRKPLIGGITAFDDAILPQMGKIAEGLLSTCYYAPALPYPSNQEFVAEMRQRYHRDPGLLGAGPYICGEVIKGALETIGGEIENRERFMQAMRGESLASAACGPVRFDRFGQAVENVYIRKVERVAGWLVNVPVHTYHDVSQFWTYDPAAFLKEPVYSKTWPPARYLEK